MERDAQNCICERDPDEERQRVELLRKCGEVIAALHRATQEHLEKRAAAERRSEIAMRAVEAMQRAGIR